MKKIATIAMVLIAAAGVTFAGDFGMALDARTNIWSNTPGVDSAGVEKPDGMSITNGDDYLGELLTTYDGEKGGGKMRFRINSKSATEWAETTDFTTANVLRMDKWQAYIVPFTGVKLSMGVDAIELVAESINWHPMLSSCLFEAGKPAVYTEITAVKNLTLIGGYQTTAQGDKTKKPFETAGALVKYSLDGFGSFIGKFENASSVAGILGKAQVIGGAFNLTAIEGLDATIGYNAIMNKDEVLPSLAQHRVEGFISYNKDKVSLSVFESAVVRDAKYGDFGNRVAVKAAYTLNDTFTPWLRVNHFSNWGADWGGLAMTSTTEAATKPVLLKIEPMVSYNLGGGIGGYFGAIINYDMTQNDMADKDRMDYHIPLGITVAF